MSENTIIVEIQYKSSCKFPISIQNAVVEKCYYFFLFLFCDVLLSEPFVSLQVQFPLI